ncbi:MAG: PEP-CTERM sorting domain-containing protein [Phycisphaerales bacterium]
MISSRLSFLVAAVPLFAAAAAHAAPFTFGPFQWSDTATTDNGGFGSNNSGGFVALPPGTGPYDSTFAFSPFGSQSLVIQSLNEYTPGYSIALTGGSILQTISGFGGTASGTASLQLQFTVNTPYSYVFTLGVVPNAGTPHPEFVTIGSYTLEKTSVPGSFTTLTGTETGPAYNGATAYFPAGDYLLTIDVTSSITGDVAAPGNTNDYGGGFTFIIPEPATLALFAVGGLLITRGRFRHARA